MPAVLVIVPRLRSVSVSTIRGRPAEGSADVETREARFGCSLTYVHVTHRCVPGSGVQPADECINRLGASLGVYGHGAVGCVAAPPIHPESGRLTGGCDPESNSLHPPHDRCGDGNHV